MNTRYLREFNDQLNKETGELTLYYGVGDALKLKTFCDYLQLSNKIKKLNLVVAGDSYKLVEYIIEMGDMATFECLQSLAPQMIDALLKRSRSIALLLTKANASKTQPFIELLTKALYKAIHSDDEFFIAAVHLKETDILCAAIIKKVEELRAEAQQSQHNKTDFDIEDLQQLEFFKRVCKYFIECNDRHFDKHIQFLIGLPALKSFAIQMFVSLIRQVIRFEINSKSNCKSFPAASLAELTPLLNLLLESSVDINTRLGGSESNMHYVYSIWPQDTGLTWAIRWEYEALAEYFLQHKANVEVECLQSDSQYHDFTSATPLMTAVRQHNIQLTRSILNASANPNHTIEVTHFDHKGYAASRPKVVAKNTEDYLRTVEAQPTNDVDIRSYYAKKTMSAMHILLLSMCEWLLESLGETYRELMHLILKAGYKGSLSDILNIGEVYGRDPKVLLFFAKLWKEENNKIHEKSVCITYLNVFKQQPATNSTPRTKTERAPVIASGKVSLAKQSYFASLKKDQTFQSDKPQDFIRVGKFQCH